MIAGASTIREALDGWLAKKHGMPAGSWVNRGWRHPVLPLERFTFPVIFNVQTHQVLKSWWSLARWVNITSPIGWTEAPFKTLKSFEQCWSFSFWQRDEEQHLEMEMEARDGGRFMPPNSSGWKSRYYPSFCVWWKSTFPFSRDW